MGWQSKKLYAEGDEPCKTREGILPLIPGGAPFPVAIIGVAFRFPGDNSDEYSFWSALREKKDLIDTIPQKRWATGELQHDKISEPGRSTTFSSGVLSRIEEFDAGFFGISPREAAWLDPQQRLLLELSWEAMENAGVLPSTMAGSDCSVYVGISSLDYGTRGLNDLASLSSHFMTGNTLSMAANRLSYVFDLHGPSLAIDTACSSSLVALHHACNGLRMGEASSALVGGVHLLLHPYPFVGFTQATMLSPDGRSKPFDAAANGYVRSEGGAVLMLKPLDKAVADGDDIQAVILASGVNADGARKTGLTIPSRDGQIELMSKVLSQSGLSADDVDYIEAHGTGTPVGDPVEASAIGAVYGQGRSRALPIGSVKANLGHMEPASGIAGLVKAVLVLKNRALPPALHLHEANPHIDFTALNLELVTRYRSLSKDGDRPLVVGVNSFGFGGANAHVLLQAAETEAATQSSGSGDLLPPLFLSAKSSGALRELGGRYAEMLEGGSIQNYYDTAFSAAYQRERMEKRLAFVPCSLKEGIDILTRYANGEAVKEIITEDCLPQNGGVAFVYSGNGAQWVGMGRKLLAESKRFREIITLLDSQIHPLTGYSVMEELGADEPDARLDDTVVAQPLLFAVQVACTLMLKDLGVEPAAVAGHSVGEVAAAWAAGALDLEQATRVIAARSTAQGKTRGTGKMAAVGLSEVAFGEVVAELGGNLDVTIAGINSQDHLTVSGSCDALERVQKYLRPKGVFFRLLDLDYAFHSRQMDCIKESLFESLSDLAPSATTDKTVFVSAVSGELLNGSDLDVQYWWRNVREPVLFAQAVTKLVELGCRTFIEIGPHAILKHYISECLTAVKTKGRVLSVLRKGADGPERIVETALRAHMLSDRPVPETFFPVPGRRVRLPNYPWQKEEHWHPTTTENLSAITRRRVHPLLGWRLDGTDMGWENIIEPITLPWLTDHKVGGAVVFPGSAYVEMGLAAAREWLGGRELSIEELDIVAPLVFTGESARTVRFLLNPRDGGFQIKSRQRLSTDQWMLHAAGRVIEAGPHNNSDVCFQPIPEPVRRVGHETHYRLSGLLGLDYGPHFQGLDEVSVGEDMLDGVIKVPCGTELEDDYLIHPAIFDVCNQSLVDFFEAEIEAGQGVAFLPVRVGRLDLFHHEGIRFFKAHVRRRSTRSVLADFSLFDSAGRLVGNVTGCRFRVAPLARQEQKKVSHWSITPKLSPHPAEMLSVELPSSSALISGALEGLTGLAREREQWFRETLPLCEALSLSFMFEAFKTVSQVDQDGLQRLIDSPSPYVRWLTALLQQEGFLSKGEGCWSLLLENDLPPSQEIWNALLRDSPLSLPQLTLLARVGRHLPELIVDESAGQEFLRALHHSPAAEPLIDDDPAYLGGRTAVENVLHHIVESLPESRRLRVLEISSGPSKLPRGLLESIPEDRLDYVLALPEEEYFQRQVVEFQVFNNLTLATFDYGEWKLAADMALPEMYDVVVLRHVLHKAGSPRNALARIQEQMVPGGVVLLAERYPDWSADILEGLNPGWWHEGAGDDGENSSSPISSLVEPELWLDALVLEGFDGVEILTESAAVDLNEGAYLLIGKCAVGNDLVLPGPETENWLLVADTNSESLTEALRCRLETQGQRVDVVERVPGGCGEEYQHVVFLVGWQCAPETGAVLLGALADDVRLLSSIGSLPPRIWLVTKGGALASDLPSGLSLHPVQTSIWGFGRVVMNEYPGLDCTLIDIVSDPDIPDISRRLENELLHPDGENEIVLTENMRYSLRMSEELASTTRVWDGKEHFRLDFNVPGKLRNLLWLSEKQRSLQEDEIEVRTRATGLNFRDVMYLMGLLPDEAVEKGFAGASLGLEFSGVVTRVGAAISEYQPGDAVMGFGSSCFASHVVTKASTVVPVPENWSFEAAATVPTVYFSVYYALRQLADLQPGERVLVHGGAGGVGIAAIRLAQHLGAEIFATVGSDEKRDFVRLLGVEHVFDSRSLHFDDDILAATDGEGVDVILNSLAGEAIRRNLRVLKPFGRFLELGKRDFFENTPIGLRYFKDNISYYGIDVDQLFVGRPALAARLFRELFELFREGVLSPLPYRVFRGDRVVDAYYEMMEARHIGKVVVSLCDTKPQIYSPQQETLQIEFESSSTWLVTGGLDGFGLESARWLVSRGVRNLVVMSRRGENTPGAKEVLRELNDQGVNVKAFSCDVTDTGKLSEVIDWVGSNMPPLTGVLHAAMVIDDRLIANLDADSLERVMRPKLTGAWNLHTLTQELPLKYFVLYSSVTTSIGNPGQANYVAANATLEGLALLRRNAGLPATCIGWGPVGDTGYLTRSGAVRDSLAQRLGKPPLTAGSALSQLDGILLSDTVLTTVANFDWGVLSGLLPSASTNRFTVLNRNCGGSGLDEDMTDFRALIGNKAPDEIRQLVRSLVIQNVAEVLFIKSDRIAPDASLHDLGLDSLMAVELAQGLEQRFGLHLPIMMFNESPTAERVTSYIIEKLLGNTLDEDGNQTEMIAKDLARQHGEEIQQSDIHYLVEDPRESDVMERSIAV